MTVVQPTTCEVYYKQRTAPFTSLQLGATLFNSDLDVDTALAGRQASGSWVVPFERDAEIWDLFYRPINDAGEGPAVRYKGTTLTVPLVAQIDDEVLSFEVQAYDESDVDDLFVENTPILIDDLEILVVKTAVDNGDGSWTLTFTERGAHGTAARPHNAGVLITVLQYTVSANAVTAQGLQFGLPAPTNLVAENGTDGIYLTWEWTGSNDNENALLAGFRIYVDTEAGVDTEDSFVPVGDTRMYTYRPAASGIVGGGGGLDTQNTYFFKVAAVDKAGGVGALSNEDSGKVYTAIIPTPDGPPIPSCEVVVKDQWLLEVLAKIIIEGSAEERYKNIDHAIIELYKGSSPSSDTTPADTQIFSRTDGEWPFAQHAAVAQIEAGVEVSYWGRAKFFDGDGNEGDWALSDVVTLTATTFTPDTGVIDPADIVIDVDTFFQPDSKDYKNYMTIGVAATANAASADRVLINILYYVDTPLPFIASGWPDAVASPGSEADNYNSPWVGDSPGPGGSYYKDWIGSSYPMTLSSVPAIFSNFKLLISAKVRNAHGWSLWKTPQEIVLTNVVVGIDTDVPTVKGFAAYTVEDPPPGTDDSLSGTMIRFDITLGDVNNSTTFGYRIYGHSTQQAPDDTVALDQDEPGVTATGERGSAVITIAGYDAEQDVFTGPTHGFRSGRLGAVQVGNDLLTEGAISSHTTGDPFQLFLSLPNWAKRIDGQLNKWAIISEFRRHKCEFYHGSGLNLIDVTGFANEPKLTHTLPPIYVSGKPNTSYYYSLIVFNIQGSSPLMYADANNIGTTNFALAAAKTIPGVKSSDVSDEAVTAASSSFEFSADDNNTVSWPSGTIRLSNGTDISITGGNSGNLTNNATYYIYLDLTDDSINFTQTYTDALGDNKLLLGQVVTTSDTNEFASIVSVWMQSGSILTAAVANIGKLSALSADVGELTAGIITGLLIRTASSGARVEQDSTSGLRTFDASDNQLLQLPVSGGQAGQIVLTVSDTVPGIIYFGAESQIFQDATGALGPGTVETLFIGPQTDNASDLAFGRNNSGTPLRWQSIIGHTSDTCALSSRGTGTSQTFGEMVTDYNSGSPEVKLRANQNSLSPTRNARIICHSESTEANNAIYLAINTLSPTTAPVVAILYNQVQFYQELRFVGTTRSTDISHSDSSTFVSTTLAPDAGTNIANTLTVQSNGTSAANLLLDAGSNFRIQAANTFTSLDQQGDDNIVIQVGGDDMMTFVGGAAVIRVGESASAILTSIEPERDNEVSLGVVSPSNKRWSDVRSVLINGADIGFANEWRFRELGVSDSDLGKPNEWFKVHASNGIQVMDSEGRIVAVFHEDGNIYLAGQVLSLDKLPT